MGGGRAIFIAVFKHYLGILIACQKVEKSTPFWLVEALFMVLDCPALQNFNLLERQKKNTHTNKPREDRFLVSIRELF